MLLHLKLVNKLYVGSIKNDQYTFLHPDNAVVAAVKMSRNAMKNAGAMVEDDEDEEKKQLMQLQKQKLLQQNN